MLVEGDDELVGGVWREKENDCVFGSKQTNLIFGTKRRRFRSIVKCLFLFGGKTKNVFGFSVLARLYIDAVALRCVRRKRRRCSFEKYKCGIDFQVSRLGVVFFSSQQKSRKHLFAIMDLVSCVDA